MQEEKRTLTEEEIKKLKRNDKIFIIGTYLVLLVLIIILVYMSFNVKSFDGAGCLSNPCQTCMDKFENIECNDMGIREETFQERVLGNIRENG